MKIARFVVFLVATAWLVYAHLQAKREYQTQLEGLAKIVNGQGKRQPIILPEKYAVIQHKNKAGDVNHFATIIPYTYEVGGKTYEGKASGLGKTAEELIENSVYYLPDSPKIHALRPREDYAELEKRAPWNWRIYLAVVTALGAGGSLMMMRKGQEGEEADNKRI